MPKSKGISQYVEQKKCRKRDRIRFWRKRKNKCPKGCPQLHNPDNRRPSLVHRYEEDEESDGSFKSALSGVEPYDALSFTTDFLTTGVGEVFSAVPKLLEKFTNRLEVIDENVPPRDKNEVERFLDLSGSIISHRAEIELPDDFDITKYPSLALYGRNDISVRDKLGMLASSLRGHWITDLDRSDPIDNQFKFMGISLWKRSLLSRLSIPLTMFLEDYRGGTYHTLHSWLHTPLGLRHMCWDLDGKEKLDSDADAGDWIGTTHVAEMHIQGIGDLPVLALRRVMRRPSNDTDSGITVETRCVLPDKRFGEIVLYQIDSLPSDGEKGWREAFHTTRILKYVHGVNNYDAVSKLENTEVESLGM